jgi:hypothetical protein
MTGLLLCLSLLASPSAQAAAAQTPREPAPVRLNGVWDLNKDISTKPMAPRPESGREGDDGGRSGGGRPGGGGGGRMPGMGGGRGGGMRGGGGGRSGGSAEDIRKARSVMEELSQSPDRLTIVSKPDAVSITDPSGVIRKFVPNDKTEKVAMNGETIEVKSKWDGEVMTQEFKAGSAKFTRTIETTVDGHQLVITVMPKGDGGGVAGPSFMRFVYDRSQLQ